jgi:hypothetical protein
MTVAIAGNRKPAGASTVITHPSPEDRRREPKGENSRRRSWDSYAVPQVVTPFRSTTAAAFIGAAS